jgi:hypothetical protein
MTAAGDSIVSADRLRDEATGLGLSDVSLLPCRRPEPCLANRGGRSWRIPSAVLNAIRGLPYVALTRLYVYFL